MDQLSALVRNVGLFILAGPAGGVGGGLGGEAGGKRRGSRVWRGGGSLRRVWWQWRNLGPGQSID